MNQIQPGERARPFSLPSIQGGIVDLETLKGRRALISFMRFASCPFCNLRIHQLVHRYPEFGPEFTIVAIFDSPLSHLQNQAEGHRAPFPILADEANAAYKAYGVRHSIAGVLKGMFFRMPTLLKAMFVHGYFPFSFRGSITTMPADFLVDEHGTVQTAYYGKDEGDHLPFDQIKAFALGREKEPPVFGE